MRNRVVEMQKGFTLVELLAVITILAIIAALVTPTIIKTINDNKQIAYELEVSNIKSATQEYVTDHRSSLDELKNIGVGVEITLGDLVDGGYIEAPIENPKTGEVLSLTETIITVTKQTNGSYIYLVVVN